MTRTVEQNRTAFQQWYARNKEGHNALRRSKYSSDERLRTEARERARQYRLDRKSGVKVRRVYRRNVSGKDVELFGSAHTADILGISAQTLLNWERRGWIPFVTSESGGHRMYSSKQIDLIARLVKLCSNASPRNRASIETLDQVVFSIHEEWRL